MTNETLRQSLDSLQSKARERTVKTQNIEYDLETLIKRIDKKTIKLDPDYQRRHRWPADISSRLIESLLLNIPMTLLHKSADGRGPPFPGQIHPTASVTGMPSAV